MTDRIKAADLVAEQQMPDKRRVRGAQRTTVGGITFDSKREAQRWQELRLMEAAREIRSLERQVPVELEGQHGPIMTDTGKSPRRYVADFRYYDNRAGLWVYEDAKGHPTDVYKIKRAILAAMKIEIREV